MSGVNRRPCYESVLLFRKDLRNRFPLVPSLLDFDPLFPTVATVQPVFVSFSLAARRPSLVCLTPSSRLIGFLSPCPCGFAREKELNLLFFSTTKLIRGLPLFSYNTRSAVRISKHALSDWVNDYLLDSPKNSVCCG